MSNKVLVFIKGKSRPVLMENVAEANIQGGALTILFEDGSRTWIADGQWREADIQAMTAPVVIQDRQVPVEEAPSNE